MWFLLPSRALVVGPKSPVISARQFFSSVFCCIAAAAAVAAATAVLPQGSGVVALGGGLLRSLNAAAFQVASC